MLLIPQGLLHSFLVRKYGCLLLPVHQPDHRPVDHPFLQLRDQSLFPLQMPRSCQIPWLRSVHTLQILQFPHCPECSKSCLPYRFLQRCMRLHVLFRHFQRLILSSYTAPLSSMTRSSHDVLLLLLYRLQSDQWLLAGSSTLPAPSHVSAELLGYPPVLLQLLSVK